MLIVSTGFTPLKHVLSPRTKATAVCLKELHDYASCVVDVTLAYGNTVSDGKRIPCPGMTG